MSLDFDRVADGAALYLHVPFCSQICDFCNFVKKQPTGQEMRAYRQGVALEWSRLRREGTASSIFWGGGTPGLLRPADLRVLGELFQPVLQSGGEWTVELTPLCVTPMKIKALREIGVNRISLGVQSFQPRLLQAMGRPYDPALAVRAVDRLRKAGFRSINLDLIIAVPGQTEEELLADLQRALALQPNHISTYCLTLEEDTALYTRLTRAGWQASEEEEAALYESAWAYLRNHGYEQYEISNFAQEGHQCQHHLNVWGMGNWRGLGPSAASQMENVRFRNPHEIGRWYEGHKTGQVVQEEIVHLSPMDRIADRICFGLRRNCGVTEDVIQLNTDLGARLLPFFNQLVHEGLAVHEKKTYRLTMAGRLLADAIARSVLGRIQTG